MIIYRKTYLVTFILIFTLLIIYFLFIEPSLFKSMKHFIPNFIMKETLKNRNLQVRRDPVITRVSVGPWNNSTIRNDDNR